jgi:hypothetical protein
MLEIYEYMSLDAILCCKDILSDLCFFAVYDNIELIQRFDWLPQIFEKIVFFSNICLSFIFTVIYSRR